MFPSVALLIALAAPPGSDALVARTSLIVISGARCLAREDIARRVEARTPRVRFGDNASIAATVTLVSQRADTVVADLTLAPQGVSAEPRRVSARSCAEAADAIALILAVTLDPSAGGMPSVGADHATNGVEGIASSGAGSPAASDSPPTSPTPLIPAATATRAPQSPPRGSREPQTPGKSPPADKAAVVKSPRPPQSPPSAPQVAPSVQAEIVLAPSTRLGTPEHAGPTLALEATAAGVMVVGAAPEIMPGISLSLTLEMVSDRVWTPAIVVGWTHVWRSEIAEPNGAASYTLDAGTLDACPLRWRWSRLVVRPCASLLVGKLSTSGSGTSQDSGAARPYSTAGLTVNARVGRTIEVAARLGLGVTLIRDSYAFGDDIFYRASFFTASASLGVGFHWQ